jgi:hypothetical protein
MKRLVLMLAAIAMLGRVGSVQASPLDVSYIVTGSTGDWTLNFSVANNLSGAPNQGLYFFGVDLSSANITGSPATLFNRGGDWSNMPYGGSTIVYNNNWIGGYTDGLRLPGTTTSGFEVTIADAVAPSSVNWFAFTADGTGTSSYTAGGNFFNNAFNPGFEGVSGGAGPSPVPEPARLTLTGFGLAGIATRYRRRRTSSSV